MDTTVFEAIGRAMVDRGTNVFLRSLGDLVCLKGHAASAALGRNLVFNRIHNPCAFSS